MKNTKIFAFYFCSFFLIVGCGHDIQKQYYETGELKEEIKKLYNDSLYTILYSKTGKILEKGKIYNKLKEGYWQEFYTDGVIKWEGKYKKGKREYNTLNLNDADCELIIKGNPSFLKVGQTYPLRIKVNGMHPEDIMLGSNNGIMKIYSDKYEYDYTMTPSKVDSLNLKIFIATPGEMTTLCNIIFIVE